MTDVVSNEARSRIMAAIRSKDTKIELKLRNEFSKMGLHYKIHYPVTGKPDLAFSKKISHFYRW